jgi:hypothetical protein
VALLLFSLIACARTLLGQAWVPDKGEATFSTSFNYVAFDGHFQDDGSRTTDGASRARSFLFGLEYGITDKLALDVTLPIVSTRYSGSNPTSSDLLALYQQAIQAIGVGFYSHQFLDDGAYHTTLQDIHTNVRYGLVFRPLLVTPFIAATIPSHNYAYVGESAPGRNLKDIQFGTDIARRLDPLLSKAYVDSQFSFTVSQAALNVRTNHTNASIEAGYLLNRKFAIRVAGQWQHSLGGLHFPQDLTTPELALTHDRLLRANFWHLGGGASYAINSKTDLSADVITFLSGSNTHYGTGLALELSRSFRINKPGRKPRHSATNP